MMVKVVKIVLISFNPLPDDIILDRSKLKQSADDSFKFDESSRKFSKGIETLWVKEKLLIMSNFSFSHSVFKRLVPQGRQNVFLCGNGLNKNNLLKISLYSQTQF